jgi:DNA-binding transcriptional ArsR family regulator
MHDDVFETLADPMRRRIVEALRTGESAVNDIVERLDIHQSGVSRHLGILRRAGFVRMRPVGPKRLYSLKPERFEELDRWVKSYRKLWEGRLERFAVELERRQEARTEKRKEPTP